MHVSALAAEIPDPVFSRLWQDRQCICEGNLPLRRSESYHGGALKNGREEGGDCAAVSGGRGAGRKGPSSAHRRGAGEGIDLEIMAAEGAGEGPPSAYGLGSRD